MGAKAGVCYHAAGVNYEMAGVCCSVTDNKECFWQSATPEEHNEGVDLVQWKEA